MAFGMTFQLLGEDKSAGEAMKGVGEAAKTAAKVASAAFAGAALGDAFTAGLETEKSLSKFAAQIGGAGPISEKAGRVAGELFGSGFGESKEEILGAVTAVGAQMVDLSTISEAELLKITKGAQTIGETFDSDITEVAFAAGNMMKNGMAPNAEAALDVLAKGMSSAANNGGDLLGIMAEYGDSFASVGLDGQTAMSMINAAMGAGAFSADIAADSVREFGTRMTDGSALASGAFDILALNGEQMVARIAAGGPDASAAMGEIMTAIANVQDPMEQGTAGAALFGGMWEDAGKGMVLAMNPAEVAMLDVAGAATSMGETLKDNTANNVAEAQRGLDGFLESAMSIPGPLGDVVAVGAAMGPAAVTMSITLATLAKGIVTGIVPAFTAMNAAMRANPILFIVGLIALLVGGFIYLWNTSEGFRNFFIGIWEAIKNTVGAVLTWLSDTLGSVLGWIKGLWESVWGGISTFFTNIWDALVFLVTNYFAIWQELFSRVLGWIKGIWESVWGGISSFFSAIFSGISDTARSVWNGITDFLGGIWNGIRNTASSVWGAVKSAIIDPLSSAWTWIQNTLGGIAGWFGNIFGGVADAVGSVFNGVGEAIGGSWDNIILGVKWAVNAMIKAVNWAIGGINTVLHGINWATDFVGIPPIPDIPKIPFIQLATGGIATSSILANIGEGSEPEAVLPLSKLDSMLANAGGGGGGGVTVNLPPGTVMVGTAAELGKVVADALIQGLRSGRIPKGFLGGM